MIQQRLKKITAIKISSLQSDRNATLEFLHYGTEREVDVILRCTLVTCKEKILQIASVSLF